MATSSNVLTIHDVNEATSVLRLRLTNKADLLADKKPPEKSFMLRAKDYAENLFRKAESDLNLETEPTNEAKERNKRKIKEVFASMRDKINKQEDDVLNKFDDLTPKQQEDIITFWRAVNDFFMDLFQWLNDVFTYVLDKIRAGFRVVKEAVKGIFKTIFEYFKQIF